MNGLRLNPTHRSQSNASNQPEPTKLRRTSADLPTMVVRPRTVPPSDKERFAALLNIRHAMLHSTNPETQLAWAQDVLRHVDVAYEHRKRLAKLQDHIGAQADDERMLQTDAMNIVIFLAAQQHPRANFLYGLWLEHGKLGILQDRAGALARYEEAANKGFLRAHYRIGLYLESKSDPTALRHYKAGKRGQDCACYFRLGMISLLGLLSQRQDYDRAIHLLRKAANGADANTPQGAYVFGMLLDNLLPEVQVPKDVLQPDTISARKHIEKAAFLGYSKAQLEMGNAYELGRLGCDVDPMLSLHYYALAARRGEAEADMAISKWLLSGHEHSIQKDDYLALQYTLRASLGDLPVAYFALGYFHETGIAIPVDIRRATQWYGKAVREGNIDAQERLDRIRQSQTLHKRDHEQVAVSKIRLERRSQQLCNRTSPPEMSSARPGLEHPPSVSQRPEKKMLRYKSPETASVNSRIPTTTTSISPDPGKASSAQSAILADVSAEARSASTAPCIENTNTSTRRRTPPPIRSMSSYGPRTSESATAPQPAMRQVSAIDARTLPTSAAAAAAAQSHKRSSSQAAAAPLASCAPSTSLAATNAPGTPPRNFSAPLAVVRAPPEERSIAAGADAGSTLQIAAMQSGAAPLTGRQEAAAGAAAGAAKPARGPQTFEEMGIPHGKLNNDCVSSAPNSGTACPAPIL